MIVSPRIGPRTAAGPCLACPIRRQYRPLQPSMPPMHAPVPQLRIRRLGVRVPSGALVRGGAPLGTPPSRSHFGSQLAPLGRAPEHPCRYPVGHRSWEFPQGTLPNRADGEPAELARRELAEETGLRARRLYHLGDLHPAKGMSSQGLAVFVAEGLETGEHAREHEEQDMRQRWVSRSDFEDMIRSGHVTDDSTLAAYLLFLLQRPAEA